MNWKKKISERRVGFVDWRRQTAPRTGIVCSGEAAAGADTHKETIQNGWQMSVWKGSECDAFQWGVKTIDLKHFRESRVERREKTFILCVWGGSFAALAVVVQRVLNS